MILVLTTCVTYREVQDIFSLAKHRLAAACFQSLLSQVKHCKAIHVFFKNDPGQHEVFTAK